MPSVQAAAYDRRLIALAARVYNESSVFNAFIKSRRSLQQSILSQIIVTVLPSNCTPADRPSACHAVFTMPGTHTHTHTSPSPKLLCLHTTFSKARSIRC